MCNIHYNLCVFEALINFSKGVMEKIKGASIDLDLIPDPETEAEQRIHRAYQKQLVAMGVPIQGVRQIIPPFS